MYSDNKELYEFGNFRLDVNEHRLSCADGTLAAQLPEKAFQTLVLLVRKAGNLVNKQELIAAVWADSIVEENNLDKAIHLIRQTLGEKSGEQKYIETVRKHGYRFVAPVNTLGTRNENVVELFENGEFPNERKAIKPVGEPIISTLTTKSGAFVVSAKWNPEHNGTIVEENGDHHEDTPVSEERPEAALPERHHGFAKFRTFAVYAGIAAALLAGAVLYLTLSGGTILGKGGTNRIAVLPFRPIDVQQSDKMHELGIADMLILKLGTDKKISVRQLNSVRSYVDVNEDPLKAGKEQNVDYVLSSSYQIANGKIKVTSNLLDVATGTVEDTFTSQNDSTDLFAAQGTIANEIGNLILARFGSDSREFRSKRGTDNEGAYRNYQQAMTLFDQQRPGSIQKAIEYLDRAVELDPNYAKGWAGKAVVSALMPNTNRSSDSDKLYQLSMQAATRALAIDPNSSEAYTALCDNKFAYEYDFQAAEADCKRAIELDPNSLWARKTYAILLNSRGRFDEGFDEIRTAMELGPASLRVQRVFANGLYMARRYEEAIEVYKRLIDLNPDNRSTYLWYIRALEESGREAEALEILIQMLKFDKKDNETIERVRAAYGSSGWPGVLRERIKIEIQEPSPNYLHIAEFYGALGDKDRAFEYLEKSSRKRAWHMMFLRVDARYDRLRDDPRFEELVRRIESEKL